MAGFEDMMNGTAMAPQAAPSGAGAPTPQEPMPDAPPGAKPITPEMQEEYNKFVAMGLLLLFDEKTLKRTLDVMERSPNVVDSVAKIAAGIVTRVYAAARKQGQDVTPEVVLHGGWEILTEVAGLADSAGLGPMTPDDIEDAFYVAADAVRQMMDKQGLIYADRDKPDEAIERARTEIGDDALQAVIRRVEGMRSRTAEGLMGRVQRQPQQEMAQ